MLAGTLVNLRAIEPGDHEVLWQWMNDQNIMRFWGRPGNTESLPDLQRREQAEASRGTSRKYIVETKDRKGIGQIDYYDLDWQNRSASVSIMIGDVNYWGGGFGTDAMHTLLHYLFYQFGLHRVTLNVHKNNLRAQKSYLKNGFVEEGTMRDWAYFDGKWEDGILMSVLAHEFPPTQ